METGGERRLFFFAGACFGVRDGFLAGLKRGSLVFWVGGFCSGEWRGLFSNWAGSCEDSEFFGTNSRMNYSS